MFRRRRRGRLWRHARPRQRRPAGERARAATNAAARESRPLARSHSIIIRFVSEGSQRESRPSSSRPLAMRHLSGSLGREARQRRRLESGRDLQVAASGPRDECSERETTVAWPASACSSFHPGRARSWPDAGQTGRTASRHVRLSRGRVAGFWPAAPKSKIDELPQRRASAAINHVRPARCFKFGHRLGRTGFEWPIGLGGNGGASRATPSRPRRAPARAAVCHNSANQ
jgi:hypothetical protein